MRRPRGSILAPPDIYFDATRRSGRLTTFHCLASKEYQSLRCHPILDALARLL
ncbi:uncharacterized protein N7473_013227 [Penicillium subrubescens]|uniref:uncharacterized protein n=1 Tax=Penicillium subrubescens TaxID=1316194 RepID=UPI002544D932|nr:uncharacterized protein N7473_013227 [Penicillium subrubescens]KAJ5873668.1 hypothetical protein N7473_013227 [Penicillium subrubescens]